jgi:ribosomal protein L37AE/L43A
MTRSPARTQVTTMLDLEPAELDVEPADFSSATCPLCETTHPSLTREALEAGAFWCCARCGQHWDAQRLQTVSGYLAWVARRG